MRPLVPLYVRTPKVCFSRSSLSLSRQLNLKLKLLLFILSFSVIGLSQNDLSLSKTVSADSVGIGDNVIFTLTVTNEGATTVNGVAVADTLPNTLTYVSSVASTGSYDENTGIWTIGTTSAATETLTITATVNAEGIHLNRAEISAMTEVDDDSTPNNLDYNEDDIATACVTAVIKICPQLNDTVRLEAPAGLSNYQWFRGVTLVSTDSIYNATEAGNYTWTADSLVSPCQLAGCCPVIIEEECFDLALYKDLAPGQSSSVEPGDLVTFVIYVVNQGDVHADSILVTDYIPGDASLEDSNWTDGGGTATRYLSVAGGELPAGGLAPTMSDSVHINLRLNSPLASNTTIQNWAEITSATDTLFNNTRDQDSDPDGTNDDLYLVDNLINDNGKNGGDEDDHDQATVTIESFDLALIKRLGASESDNLVSAGDDVTFDIVVINQGQIAADSIEVYDYMPFGTSLNDPNWTDLSTDASRYLDANDELGPNGLEPGDSVLVSLTISIDTTFEGGTELINWAEIGIAQDIDGNPQEDVDSTPDVTRDNDNYYNDNDVSGDGKNGEDEDDHDPASLIAHPFDLALYKELAPGQSENVEPGDLVTFRIYLVNQGGVSATNIMVTDSIPSGTMLEDGSWSLSGNLATYTYTSTLSPGESDFVDISLRLDVSLAANTIIWNWAEISQAEDPEGNVNPTDVDSTPDNDFENDTYISDNEIQGDGKNGGDEDDHDPASVIVLPFDLALYKQLAPGQTDFVAPGDTVTFRIYVTNQGDITADNIRIYDYIPADMTLADMDWNLAGSNADYTMTAGNELPGAGLASGETAFVDIDLKLNALIPGGTVVTNWAEILSATDDDANNQEDIDSDTDLNQNNDVYLIDDYIDGDGKNGGDEDDHDPASITVQSFDLALYKKLANGQNEVVEPGDTISFTITVINQGDIAANNIMVVDYYGDDMTPVDANWSSGIGNTVVNNLSIAEGELGSNGLEPGDSVNVDIQLRVNNPITSNTIITNAAEIFLGMDVNNNLVVDEDSTPDNDEDNDTFLIDNDIDGDGKNGGDEDDHDIAQVTVSSFDLALYKQLAPGQSASTEPGDTVTFRIYVVNQGMITADSIEIIDYIPSEMNLADSDWTAAGLNATRLLNSGDELALTGLDPAEEIFVDIDLVLKSPLPQNTEIVNWAEIAAATDDQGNEQEDVDSDPDDSNDDTFLIDDYIDGDGMNGGDEDDHDVAILSTNGFDLALWKTLADGQSMNVEPGDTINFSIKILNQGMIAADSIEITDYIPDELTLLDSDWTDNGSTASILLNIGDELAAGGLKPDSLYELNITMRVNEGLVGGTDITNWAEISFARDDNGNVVIDGDSTPDSDVNNDMYLQDNEVDGNGKSNGDEDDHDPAFVHVMDFDLALYKILGSGEDNLVVPGDTVHYQIILVNQGEIYADNIIVSDSIPTGMTLMDINWVQVGDIATRTLNSGDELPVGGLAPGMRDTVSIVLKVPNPLPTNSRLVNWAEISNATDENGHTVTDVDSDMDDDFENDAYVIDDYIDGDGKNGGDEDDHDPAEVMYEVFDIALRKTVDNIECVQWGEDVTFTITIFNQGTIVAQDVEIYDWIPAGFVISINDFNGWLYAGSQDVVKTEIDDEIFPGDSAKVKLVLTVQENACLEDLVNQAEVVNQEDEFGQNMNAEDIDSSPDKDPDNDVAKDDEIHEDGKNMVGDDEDDNDFQEPPVFDLAVRLTTTQTLPVRIGDDVPYGIKVFNQGNIKAQNVELKVTFPFGFELSTNDTVGWTDNGDGTATYLLADMVARDDSIMTDILLTVTKDAHEGDLTTHVEIQSAQNMAGDDKTGFDIDSDYDMDTTNDLLVDDEINSCRVTDEDDHDIAEVELFDLAIRKTIDDDTPAQWLEDVSFTVTIFNQSPELTATDVELIDYIPEGFILSPNDGNGWADMDSVATLTYTGDIAPGDSAKVQILLQVEKGTDAGFYNNTSEITAAQDTDGRDLTDYDFDSVPDTDIDNDNDNLTDNEIDEHGGRVPDEDEDDHDIAPVEVEIIDLALRKTTEQDICVLYGQDVDFTLTVFNQGSRIMQEVELIDYVPLGFKLSPLDSSGWVFNASTATATLTMHKVIAPGDSAKIDIRLRVEQGADPYTFANRAEIVSAQDDAGVVRTGDDIDSDWDTNPDNDLLEDDVIDQMANMGGTDEDDHDIESVDIFDLALRKTTPANDKVTIGWDVPFDIEIFNQGMVAAQNVGLIDHLPFGFELSPNDTSGWIDNLDGTISNVYSGTIAPQTSVVVNVLLRVAPYAEAGIFENIAEITYAEDSTGTDRSDLDIDSNYDEIPDNDNYIDDEIQDDGDIDEDDNDREEIEVEIIDVALRKITQFNDQEPVKIGDDVHFAIEVFNQGSYPIDTIDVVDYIPEGFYLSPMDGNGWTVIGDKAYNTIVGPIDTMQSKSIGIVLRVDDDAHPDNLVNGAEVIRIIDEDGDDRSDDDRDSDPDEMPDNDAFVDDEIQETPPTDEDDHDLEATPVFDLALRKTTEITTPVTVGDTATFTITIFNQGNLGAQWIGIQDSLPSGFGLNGSDANGWTDNGDGTVSNLLEGPIEPGDSLAVDIDLVVLASAEAGIFENIAEITSAEDSTGTDRTDFDLDSQPDTDPTNDNLTDNIIDENGQGGNDEDDHDVEPIEVEIIDLAIRKTTDQADPVEVGDDVIFEIEVLNQGSVTMDNIEVIDHYPPGFVLSPNDANGWSDNGDGTASITLPVSIAPGMNYTIGIVLRLDNKEELGALYNVAELTYFEDENGDDRTDDDRDSVADTIPNNDDIVDNEVDETPPTDEDDQDTAQIQVDGYDLAARKVITSIEPFYPGDTVSFEIEIFNQGTLTAYAIQLNDYIPDGMSLVDGDWTATGSIANLNTPIAWLNAGDSTTVTIDLKIDDDYMGDYLVNMAEVDSFEDDMGGNPLDEDSTPDDDGENDDVVNDEINEEPPVDEDDHDEEGFDVTQIYDLALYKKLATGQSQPVEPGDTVRFTIFVVNQGTLNAYDVEVTDYIPADMIYQTAMNTALMTSNSNDWAADTTYTIVGPLSPGDTTSIDIILIIDENTTADMLENEAEISAADDDTDSGNTPPNDEDSVFDDLNDDFIGGNNFIQNENGDEDDHDFEPISLIEIPLGSISGETWFDCDPDGIHDGEDPMPNVPVMLIGTEDSGAAVNLSTTTASDGSYSFTHIKPGTYTVKFGFPNDPTGLMLTLQNQGGDDTIDSDADQTTGESHTIVLFGEDITDVDAGYKDAEAPGIQPVDPLFDTAMNGDTIMVECDQIPTLDKDDVIVWDNITDTSDIHLVYKDTIVYLADSCALEGFIEIHKCTWTATDECGNESQFCLYVKVQDTTPPVLISAPPAVDTIECGEQEPMDFPVFEDNCDSLLHMEAISSISILDSCTQVISRSWTVYDDCGNSNSYGQTIYIIDTTPPAIVSAPADVTIECDEPLPTDEPIFDDECTDSLTITTASSISMLACGEIIERTWTATDECGHETTVTQIITIEDTEAPEITNVPDDLTVECGLIPTILFGVEANDNCDPDPVLMDTVVTTGQDPCVGYEIYHIWVATDSCGNEARDTMTMFVQDTEPPILSEVPADVTIECGTIPPLFEEPDVFDLCDQNITVFLNVEESGQDCNKEYLYIWSATDDCGNTALDTTIVILEDTTAPVLSDMPGDVTVECADDVPTAPVITATDNCDDAVIVLADSTIVGNQPCDYQITRTWTAIDSCDNQVTHTQIITIKDDIAPVISGVPGDVEVDCTDDIPLPNVSVTDNCDDQPDVQLSIDTIGSVNDCDYMIIRLWTATDDCGNESTASYKITVKDTIPPEITGIPDDFTLDCDDECPPPPQVSISDNCDDDPTMLFEEEIEGDTTSCEWQKVWSWKAFDECDNLVEYKTIITFIDQEGPIITPIHPDLVGLMDGDTMMVECDNVPLPDENDVIAADDCSEVDTIILMEMVNNGDCLQDGYLFIMTCIWKAYDECGNESTWTIYVKVQDTVAPELQNVPDDITVECDDVPDVPDDITATDNCDDNLTVVYDEQRIDGNCPHNYELIRTWSVTDECGNETVETQTVTVQDTTDPVFANVPADVTIECDDPIPTDDPTASDNCSDEVIIDYNESETPGNCVDEYILTRIWVATDSCGNSTTVQQIVTIEDNTPPVLANVPADVTIECDDQIPTGFPTATDNCDDDVDITMEDSEVPGDCPQEKVITRTFTATDNCGNQSTAEWVITIEDNTPPVLVNVPDDVTLECDEDLPTDKPDVSDNCDDNITVVINDDVQDGICEDEYVITRTFTATDDCGNEATATQVITVEDNTAPVFLNAPQDITVNCDEIPPAEDCPAEDNCDDDLVLLYEEDLIGDPDSCIYQLKRQWKAVDNCGNQTDLVQIITVQDTEGPTITPTHPDLAGIMNGDTLMLDCNDLPVLDETDVDVTDNCCDSTSVEFVEFITQADCEEDGYLMLMRCGWVATDCCGNESEFFVYILVKDETPPTLMGVPDDVTVECDDVPDAPDVTAMDNCDNDLTVEFDEDEVDGNCEDEYQIIRVWSVTDDCGNETTASQVVTVEDNTAPVLSNIPADVTIDCDDPLPTDEPDVDDNCDDDVVIITSDFPEQGCPFTITRTWTATDNCGNTSTATQIITVEDNTPPTIDAPDDITIECDEQLPPDNASAFDNCDSDVEMELEEETEDLACGQRITRTWTATDDCDNTSTAVQVITLTDTTAPEFVDSPQDITVDCDDIPDPEDCVATDNCDDDVETAFTELVDDDDPCEIKIKRIWTAEDDCGNTSSIEQIITVVDDEAPVITPNHPELQGVMDGDTLMYSCEDATVFGLEDVDVTDNCTDPTVEFVELITDVGDCDEDGYLFIIRCCWIAEDECGNVSEFCIYVKISDENPPMIMDVPDDITVECHEIPDPDMNVTGMDECDDNVDILFSEFTIPGPCDGTFTIQREWTATDDCGNETTGTQIVNVVDTTPPLIVGVPDDITVECDDIPDPDDDVKAIDNCDDDPILEFEEIMSGDCPYTLTRTWRALDDCGNMRVATQIITVDDTTMPELVGVPDDITLDCIDDVPTPANVTAEDNCDDDPDITYNEDMQGDNCDKSITRTWTATDECGNTTVESQTITVIDNIDPEITGIPDDITVDCENIPDPATVIATDNCDDQVDLVFDEQMSDGCPYTITRTWTATDDCGNETSGQQIITVFDDVMPEFANPPADITVDCTEIPDAEDCPATDNCDEDLEYTFLELVGTGDCEYEIKRVWTAEDDCGNLATVEQIITVVDNSPPILTFTNPLLQGLQDGDMLTLECDSLVFFDENDAIAVDECDADAQVMFMEGTPEIGDCETDGYISQISCTWIAKDDCGNADSVTLLIKVVDTEAPVFTNVPDDLTIDCDGDIPAAVDPEVEDCTNVSVEFDEETDVNGCTTIVTRTWTATDDCGNTWTASQSITRTDNSAPVFANIPADVTIGCNDPLPIDEPTASDSCGDVTITSEDESETNGCTETITRTWTAVDECGNEATATQIITRTDDTQPVFANIPADVTIDCEAPLPTDEPTASDDCGDVTMTSNDDSQVNACTEIITRTWTAVDECGNETTATQIITRTDDAEPVFADIPADITINCDDPLPTDEPTATDNCGDVTMTSNDDSQVNACTEIITRTWTAVDECGNEATASQIITIEDNTAPVLVGVPDDLLVDADGGETVPNPATVTVTDNCQDNIVVGFMEVQDSSDCEIIITRTWSAADSCGNNVSDSQTITVLMNNLNVQIVSTSPESCDENDGAAELSPQSLSYAWSDGGNGFSRNDLAAGTYTVTATSNANCSNTITVIIEDDCDCIEPQIDQLVTTNTTCGEDNGVATVTVIGNASDYTYTWSPDLGVSASSVDNSRTDLPAGTYDLTISNPLFLDCEIVVQLVVGDSDVPTVSSVVTPASCAGNDGTVSFSPLNYTYEWGDFTGATRTDLEPGTYQVTVTTADLCVIVETILVPSDCDCIEPVLDILSLTHTSCGEDNGAATINLTEDESLYVFDWIPNLGTPTGIAGNSRTDLPAGDYLVIIVYDDNDSCELKIEFTIDPSNPVQPSVSENNAETCVGGDGDVVLVPDTLTYNWSDGGTGDQRDDLVAGVYTITATDNSGCSSTFDVEVLNNGLMNVEIVTNDPADCDEENGYVVLSPDSYTYDWSDGGTGYWRDDLPAGTYLVNATGNVPGCSGLVTVVVEEIDCKDCPDIFYMDTMNLLTMLDTTSVCIPVPYMTINDYNVTIDGVPYSLPIDDCNSTQVVFYTYSTLVLGNWTGPYAIDWIFNGSSMVDTVNTIDELVDFMNSVDVLGFWMNDPSTTSVVGGDFNSNYGNLNIVDIPTQLSFSTQPNFTTIPMGSEIQIPGLGTFELVITEVTGDCSDTLIIVIDQGPSPLPGDFIDAEFAAVGMNCDFNLPTVCVEIPYNDMGDYIITNNGQPFTGTLEPCNFEASRYYNYLNLPGLGNDGPYSIDGWTINGVAFSGIFNTIGELATMMNQWDANGSWELDVTGYNILGGESGNNYGSMTISQTSSGIISIIEVNSNYLPNSTAIVLPPGMNELIVTRIIDGVADTLTAAIACVTPEHMYNEIIVNQQDTICLESDELMGDIMEIYNICEDQNNGSTAFDIIPGTTCISCIGLAEGNSEACFVICDEYGLCDTTYMEVDVRALDQPQSQSDTMYTDLNTIVVGNVTNNDYLPDAITSMTIVRDPENGTATINPDGTISYEPYEDYCNSYPGANLDFLMYQVCTDGGCTTSIVYIEVECGDLVIHTGFSPNGDGINDFFHIEGLGNYPEHKLCIFSRWGTKVFCTEEYKNDWGGTWNANDLPTGTYFFVLDVGDEERYTGFVQINR